MKTPSLILTIVLLCLAAQIHAAERLENYTNKTVLVFTPHPDDDTFAVGGTLALLAKKTRTGSSLSFTPTTTREATTRT